MSKYEILRPCMWFAKGDFVPCEKVQEYFTAKAIRSLLEYGFIKIFVYNNE